MSLLSGTVALLAAALVGCEQAPAAASLSEWTPADHRSNDDKSAMGTQAARPASSARGPAPGEAAQGGGTAGIAQLIDLAWRQQCASCHGPTGKGDGQLGPMVRAPDLTRGDWQEKVADGEIAAIITNGKGKMPKFELPSAVVQGLVSRIRASREP